MTNKKITDAFKDILEYDINRIGVLYFVICNKDVGAIKFASIER